MSPSTGAEGHEPTPEEVGLLATEALGPEAQALAEFDTAGFARALGTVTAALAQRPLQVLECTSRYGATLAAGGWSALARSFGFPVAGPMRPDARDHRFQDASWQHHPLFYGMQQWYLAWSRWLHELIDAAGVEPAVAEKAHVATEFLVDALSPTNFLWSNPAALRRAVDTRGLSVLAGLRNFFHDLAHNGGKPSQVDTSAFRLGENLAATPGQVVFRNDLMELIQYSPQTETTYEVPLLLSPPWINKYYIMDLAPGRSFVEWAVSQGHTVFAISYRNPDESMRNVALDDYLLSGPYQALDVIADITGTDQVNIVGLCLGGTLTVMLIAHLAANGGHPVRSATLLNTMVDFTDPGPMGHFLDSASVERLDRRMQRRGYLEASEMAGMFDFLRARDLIWNYVSSGWLMGEKPPAFDILAWNADGTRMPADMHSFYLRCCYVENQLAQDQMTLAGTELHLKKVEADAYILAAKEDHIAPWKSSYATTRLLGGDVRFVLSSSGHVAGIVNPPRSRRVYWTNDELPPDPEAWRAGAEQHDGSWWHDWAAWIAARAGDRRPPSPMGSTTHRPIEPAPGTYVRQK
jgi:polyhydroxyalkanoate synthase subunit PhaC